MFIVIAFKSFDVHAEPTVIFAGIDGEKANAAIEASQGKGFVRGGKLSHPTLIPVVFEPKPLETAKPKAVEPKPVESKPAEPEDVIDRTYHPEHKAKSKRS